jgi:hypothetical protein
MNIFSSSDILNISYRNLKVLPEISENIKVLICNNNEIENIEYLPKNVLYLDCSFNNLKNCNFIKDTNLHSLIIKGNRDIVIDVIPSSLKFLDCSFCKIKSLPYLNNIEVLICKGNKLVNLTLNESIQNLDASKNLLVNINKFPTNMNIINLSNNKIKELPEFGPNLISLNLQDNPLIIEKIPEIPILFGLLNLTSYVFKNVPKINKHTLIKYSTGDEIPLGKFVNISDVIFKDDRIIPYKNVNIKCIDFITMEEYNMLDFLGLNSNNILLESNGSLFCYRRNELEKHIGSFDHSCGYSNQIVNRLTGEKSYKLYMREYILEEDYKMLNKRYFSVYKLEKTNRSITINENKEYIYKVTPYTLFEYLNNQGLSALFR